MTGLRGLRASAVLIAALLVSACAFGDRQVVLEYPAAAAPEAGVVPAAQAAEAPARTGVTVHIAPFSDNRDNKRTIGDVRNGFNMKTADVLAKNDVADWVTKALEMELEKVGFAVARDDGGRAAGPRVAGQVRTVYCRAFMSYEGKVSFVASVSENGKNLINKRYSGKGSAGLNMAATSASYNQSLARALAEAVGDLVADLKGLYL